jgi:hypothetical protein
MSLPPHGWVTPPKESQNVEAQDLGLSNTQYCYKQVRNTWPYILQPDRQIFLASTHASVLGVFGHP